MRRTISLLLLSNASSSIRQISFSKPALWCISTGFFICLLTAIGIGIDYFHLRTDAPRSRVLESELEGHQLTIANQRKHIQELGSDINTLKSELTELKQFEDKIRIIANIKRTSGQESLFGIGGNIPEDINTSVSVTEDHSSLVRHMHEQTDQLDVASADQEAQFRFLVEELQDQQNLLASTPAIRPTTGWITSGFGYRTSPFTGQREFHEAIDIATQEGTPVISSANGVVTFAGNKGLLGKVLIVDHGYGMVTRYGHLKKTTKKPGEKVKRGDQIGLVGISGRTTGPHLHYEVHLNGIPVNPNKYILN